MKELSDTAVRTALFVPATRLDRVTKALASGADRVIVDLEDAVPEADKEQARSGLAQFLADNPQVRVLVRVNRAGHVAQAGDIELCRQPGVTGVLLPKAESARQVALVAACGKPVWPLVETAAGVLALAELARAPDVERLSFGSLDLSLDLGLRDGSTAAGQVLDQTRYQLILHSAAAGLAQPLDTVCPVVDDPEILLRVAGHAADMGFGGMLCIHPRQVGLVHQALSPTDERLAWARRILAGATSGAGVFLVDGQMVDAPVIARARRILQQAGQAE